MAKNENRWHLRTGARPDLLQKLPAQTVRRWLAVKGLDGARAIASHLRPPSVDDGGQPLLHPLTEYVLSNWGDDEAVLNRFMVSTHQLQVYTGDIASEHRNEAERARRFLSHRIPAVRKWAEREVALGEQQARQWTILQEEQFLN